ncbi:dienelactone hydrolase family protein [Labrys monachus]|uniref:Pimeloyl-ACP methyl ester carboxylesterase n=1 Tax=Labrys monachus TaxID=217067 RepID=A0ABU0F961_9HYPH|nr:dienelactone hydrolase family protein [Labrys monachus]MDQ0391151.1 pimeloyl-ACP methyl ester carboxylesterase [Labrys monachus]
MIREILISSAGLPGTVRSPPRPAGLVVFVHGSGSSRFSPRNGAVARGLHDAGFATLLFDLLTAEEERDRGNVFDIPLLAGRVIEAVGWIDQDEQLCRLPLGLFGASTGAAAALMAAASPGTRVGAIVSRGGRPDLAGDALARVRAPTLLIVGGCDVSVVALNEQAMAALQSPKALCIVPGATHLFSESGALEAVIRHAAEWFTLHLARRKVAAASGPP